ncbi:hypothetical protein D9611_014092 [Ephemerocybe angulata]|uniref:Uncharacterized protein n=1 Tax=Ephemerocybe angulata TaxID=980116 RepID=A0A8H5BA85_9AGAR|nr:hypothetical protein D9611_014092 [Tulosesus angulatus]
MQSSGADANDLTIAWWGYIEILAVRMAGKALNKQGIPREYDTAGPVIKAIRDAFIFRHKPRPEAIKYSRTIAIAVHRAIQLLEENQDCYPSICEETVGLEGVDLKTEPAFKLWSGLLYETERDFQRKWYTQPKVQPRPSDEPFRHPASITDLEVLSFWYADLAAVGMIPPNCFDDALELVRSRATTEAHTFILEGMKIRGGARYVPGTRFLKFLKRHPTSKEHGEICLEMDKSTSLSFAVVPPPPEPWDGAGIPAPTTSIVPNQSHLFLNPL